jgi:uncharacterized protein (DUF1684 family)
MIVLRSFFLNIAVMAFVGFPAGMTSSAALAAESVISQAPENHRESIQEWRQARHERLASHNGWLTLVGLEWLQEGENQVGRLESKVFAGRWQRRDGRWRDCF